MNESFRFSEKVEFELHTTAFKNGGMVKIYLQYSFEENDLQLNNVKYCEGNLMKEVPMKVLKDLPREFAKNWTCWKYISPVH